MRDRVEQFQALNEHFPALASPGGERTWGMRYRDVLCCYKTLQGKHLLGQAKLTESTDVEEF